MQPVLHMFWKDARHLWREIAVTWAMLGYLTRLDSLRTGYTPELAEGWLNVLLPLAWSYLAALCILQDPVPGERQFWLTLPLRRSALFASKALFVIAFIQVPYFLSTVLIVGARDFNPVQFLPHLFEKQFFLFFALTLPSLALATVAKNAAHYMILALAICGSAILTAGNGSFAAISQWPVPWQDLAVDEVPRGLVLLLLGLFSTLVLWIQYSDRLTGLSRIVGIAGLVAAAAVYLWLPPRSSASLEAALRPGRAGPIAVRLREGGQKPNLNDYSGGNQIFVPLEITGRPAGGSRILRQLDLEIDAPSGITTKADNVRPGVPLSNASLVAYIIASEGEPTGLRLYLDRHTYDLLAHTPVTLKGHFEVTLFSRPGYTALPQSGPIEVPNLGRCVASNANGKIFLDDLLAVACESPNDFPMTQVSLTDLDTGRHWDTGLGMSVTNSAYPRYTWLSPMSRREGFFHLTTADANQPGSQWLVPKEVLGDYRLEIEPLVVAGRAVVAYEIPGIQLNRFQVNPAR